MQNFTVEMCLQTQKETMTWPQSLLSQTPEALSKLLGPEVPKGIPPAVILCSPKAKMGIKLHWELCAHFTP